MSPFLEFRRWLKHGRPGEQALTAVIAAIALGLAAAALLPVTAGTGPQAGVSVTAGGAPSPGFGSRPPATQKTGGTTGATTAAVLGSTAGGGLSGPISSPAPGTGSGSGVGTSTGGSTGCAPQRTASAAGVTRNEVHLDMANVSLAGPIGNQTFHVRPDLTQIAAALAADINEHGGVACGRKLVLKQYDVNPLDANDSQAKCLQMAADKPFMVFNFGAYLDPAARQCLVQARVLQQSGTQVDQHELQASYPYLFTATAVGEQMVDAAVAGFARRGFFTPPRFQKIGLFEDRCDPAINKRIEQDLAKAGITSSQISTFELECNVASPPNEIEQGVLKHKGDNVTHVLLASSETNDQNYVRIARGQVFAPQYLVTDYGANTSGAGTSNWDSAFDGAVAVTTTRVGELSSGIRNPQVVACDKALRKHGVPGVQSENDDTSAMEYCDMFWLVRQALNRAGTNPTARSYLEALSTMGLFRSMQAGDGYFDRPGKLTGGDFERQITFRSSCGCWRIVDRTVRRIG